MGVPKRRQSKSRKNMRRSIWAKLARPALVKCPQCHALHQPHHVCPQCGYYRNRTVVESQAK